MRESFLPFRQKHRIKVISGCLLTSKVKFFSIPLIAVFVASKQIAQLCDWKKGIIYSLLMRHRGRATKNCVRETVSIPMRSKKKKEKNRKYSKRYFKLKVRRICLNSLFDFSTRFHFLAVLSARFHIFASIFMLCGGFFFLCLFVHFHFFVLSYFILYCII